jgi:hypothetical protein
MIFKRGTWPRRDHIIHFVNSLISLDEVFTTFARNLLYARYGAACWDCFLLRVGIAAEKLNAGEASKQKLLG